MLLAERSDACRSTLHMHLVCCVTVLGCAWEVVRELAAHHDYALFVAHVLDVATMLSAIPQTVTETSGLQEPRRGGDSLFAERTDCAPALAEWVFGWCLHKEDCTPAYNEMIIACCVKIFDAAASNPYCTVKNSWRADWSEAELTKVPCRANAFSVASEAVLPSELVSQLAWSCGEGRSAARRGGQPEHRCQTASDG